jgi:predicted GTPase
MSQKQSVQLAGRRISITDPTPGVTREHIAAEISL